MRKHVLLLTFIVLCAISCSAQKALFYKGDSFKGTLISADSISYTVNDFSCVGFDLSKCLPASKRMYIVEFTYHKWVFTASVDHVFDISDDDDLVVEIFEKQSEIPEWYNFVSIDDKKYAPEAVINCKWCSGTYISVGEKN